MTEPLPISDGLPDPAIGWPKAVADASALFESGDVIERPPFFYYADTRHGIWAATLDYAEEDAGAVPLGPELIDAAEYAPEYGIITSQTCDIGEIGFNPRSRPWVMVSPVYDMQAQPVEKLTAIRAGRHSSFLIYLPGLPSVKGQVWVADLRIEVPIEKSMLVDRTPIHSFASDLDQKCVAERVAQLRSRPAWSEAIVGLVTTLSEFLKQTKADDRDLYKSICTEIDEIGARVDSMSNPTTVQLAAFSASLASEVVQQWWSNFFVHASERHGHEFSLQASVLLNLSTCPVIMYRQFQPIPFRQFSRA